MHPNSKSIYQTAQIRQIEKALQAAIGKNDESLMLRAARAAFLVLQQEFSGAHQIHVYCGGGNNGGDGYTLALLAKEAGLNVTIWQIVPLDELKGEAKEACLAAQNGGISILPFSDETDSLPVDLVVDAICGIGLNQELRGLARDAVLYLQKLNKPCLALDVPTGVNADTGAIMGLAVQAAVTVTFIGMKLGLLTGDGASLAGKVVVAGLGDVNTLELQLDAPVLQAYLEDYSQYLQPRPKNWHKGLSGRVLVVGGDMGFAGAPLMAARAAMSVGAGLVSIATHPQHAAAMDASCEEVMCHAVQAAEELIYLLEKADVVVVGPGLGQSAWSVLMYQQALEYPGPMVLDADALNLLARHSRAAGNWVLTPHPGEAARLLATSTDTIQANRLETVLSLVQKYQSVCVLKGAGSLIASPDEVPALCAEGNPGMATAGMGDILSGVIAGLIAQSVPMHDAAVLGVCMHARAGDMAAVLGERGMIATDLLPFLRQLSNQRGESETN